MRERQGFEATEATVIEELKKKSDIIRSTFLKNDLCKGRGVIGEEPDWSQEK